MNAVGGHACFAPGCTVDVAREYLCCPRHWRAIPRHLQRLVLAAWRDFQAGRCTGRELRAAQAQALAALGGSS